jgi:hypothetical protein
MTDKTDRELLEDMSVNLATLTENGVKVKFSGKEVIRNENA